MSVYGFSTTARLAARAKVTRHFCRALRKRDVQVSRCAAVDSMALLEKRFSVSLTWEVVMAVKKLWIMDGAGAEVL